MVSLWGHCGSSKKWVSTRLSKSEIPVLWWLRQEKKKRKLGGSDWITRFQQMAPIKGLALSGSSVVWVVFAYAHFHLLLLVPVTGLTVNLRTPWTQSSNLQNCEKKNFFLFFVTQSQVFCCRSTDVLKHLHPCAHKQPCVYQDWWINHMWLCTSECINTTK